MKTVVFKNKVGDLAYSECDTLEIINICPIKQRVMLRAPDGELLLYTMCGAPLHSSRRPHGKINFG
jgi:hypothetical protein